LFLQARHAATVASVPFLERGPKVSLRQLLERSRALIVFEAASVSLVDERGSLQFTPGIAHLRVKQLDAGVAEDMLLRVGGMAQGDEVLDCTLGLAGDAQVAARVVGPNGSVTALEKSPELFLLTRHGLSGLPRHPRSAEIEVLNADAHTYLRAL